MFLFECVFNILGDTIYPPSKGTATISELEKSYNNMKYNKTLGYVDFKPKYGVYGTWDDHDYGGNDRGYEINQKDQRQKLFLDFLDTHKDSNIYKREGVYNSVIFGGDKKQVKVIFLDTRYHRERHCIPSVAAISYIHPLGAIIACFTRWLYSGLDIIPSCKDRNMLGEEQWLWLENELRSGTASIHVIISSVQIFTANPFVESWAHYQFEKRRLLYTINNTKGVVFLSGDVHFAEMTSLKQDKIMEITSSGLSHSCATAFYGPLCPFIINAFSSHRRKPLDYSLKRNFGSIKIDWDDQIFSVNVHDNIGNVDLSTGDIPIGKSLILEEGEIDDLLHDNAVNRRFVKPTTVFGLVTISFMFAYFTFKRKKIDLKKIN